MPDPTIPFLSCGRMSIMRNALALKLVECALLMEEFIKKTKTEDVK